MSRKRPTGPVVSLAVHKNTVERRQKRDRINSLVRETKKMIAESDIRAYAVVGIAADGSGHALWDTGDIVPMWAFTDVIANLLRRDIENNLDAVAETWRPPLTRPKP